MQFNNHQLGLASPESWLIILIFAGFWGSSYFSLVSLLIHIYQRDSSSKSEEQPLEITS